MSFQKATKHQLKLRSALFGPSGSGKTMSPSASPLDWAAPLPSLILNDAARASMQIVSSSMCAI